VIGALLVARSAAPQGDPLGQEFRVNTQAPLDIGSSSLASPADHFVVVWDGRYADGNGFRGVVGQRFDSAGNPLGTEFHVNTYTTGQQQHPGVGADVSGGFVVVWENGPFCVCCSPPCPPPHGMTVAGQRYSASGVPLGPEFIVSAVADYVRFPKVAIAPSGAFLVVWSKVFGYAPPGPSDVYARSYDSSGVPQGPEFRVNSYWTFNQAAPSVAADPAGNFVVVWSNQYQYSNWEVFGQRYAASGAPLGPEFRVNTNAAGNQGGAAVATDPSGNFVVAWSSDFSGDPGLFGQRFASSGAPIGPEFRINTYTPGLHYDPGIAVDAAGNFVIVWFDGPSATVGDVFGQRYSSVGVPDGPEFRVNTTTTDWQRDPSVASTPNGIFLVTWVSGPSSGPPYPIPADVFGQRYGGIFPVELMHFRVE
jgi:hypothetical protein